MKIPPLDKSAISVCPRIFMFTATAYAGRGVYGGNNYAKETREVQHQRQEQARQRALQAPPFNPHQDFFPRTSSGFRRSHKNNQEVFPTNWSNIHAPSTALWLGAAHPGHIAFAVQREVTYVSKGSNHAVFGLGGHNGQPMVEFLGDISGRLLVEFCGKCSGHFSWHYRASSLFYRTQNPGRLFQQ